jgi:hypothetical protein
MRDNNPQVSPNNPTKLSGSRKRSAARRRKTRRKCLPGNDLRIPTRSRPSSDAALLRGAERAACWSGGTGRGLAMVESVALAAPRSDGRRAAVDGLARGAAAAEDDASKPSASDRGVIRDTNLGATRTALRQRGLAGSNRREARPRIHVSPPRKTKERHLIGHILIPFFVPSWRTRLIPGR